MPSSYTDLLRLTKPADGELVGTWGQTVNNGITELEEDAIAGTANIAIPDADKVLTVANGATDEARAATLNCTGALTAQRNVVCPSVSKNYFVRNNTTGGFGVQIKTAAGTGVVVAAGRSALVYCDGVNVVEAVTTGGAFVLKTGDTMSGVLIINSPGAGVMALNSATTSSVVSFQTGGVSRGYIGLGPVVTDGASTVDLGLSAEGGIFFGGAGGIQRMQINAGGRVAIGGQSLDYGAGIPVSLQVHTSSGQSQIATYSAGATSWLGLYSGGAVGFDPAIQFPAGGTLRFATVTALPSAGFTERMRIDAAGNVGIGKVPTVGAAGSRAVQVNSDAGTLAYFDLWQGNVREATFYTDASVVGLLSVSDTKPLTFGTGGGIERMRITPAGVVGVGIVPAPWAAPFKALEVFGVTLASQAARVGSLSANIYYDGSNYRYKEAGAGNLYFIDGSIGQWQWYAAPVGNAEDIAPFTERMRITAAGALVLGAGAPVSDVAAQMTIHGSGETQLTFHNTALGVGSYTRIGTNNANHFFVVNNASVGVVLVNGQTSWAAASDERLKTNLQPIDSALSKVGALRAVTGNLLVDAGVYDKRRVFLIAQDVQAVLPEAVYEMEDGMLSLAYTEVIPLLVAAIKEMKSAFDTYVLAHP